MFIKYVLLCQSTECVNQDPQVIISIIIIVNLFPGSPELPMSAAVL